MAIAILVPDDQVKGEPPAPQQGKALDVPGLVGSLRALALTGLGRMYRPDTERFVFSFETNRGSLNGFRDILKRGVLTNYSLLQFVTKTK